MGIDVLIVEDEKLAEEKLRMLLDQCDAGFEVKGACSSIDATVTWLGKNSVDLIFCDIHLSDGNAFGIFEIIDITTPIIFTTAYDQYALKAFEQNSIDYLLKPIELDALQKSLHKFQQRALPSSISYAVLAKLLRENVQDYKRRFLVSIGSKMEAVDVNDIAYFYSHSKSTFIKTFSNKTFSVDESLSATFKFLDPFKFYHLNRKIIISIHSIDKIIKVSPRKNVVRILPDAPFEVVIPEERFTDFKDWLNK